MRGLSGRSERSLVGATKNNWGIITGRDHKMVDEAWHRFWAKRGRLPPKVSSLYVENQVKEKRILDVDKD